MPGAGATSQTIPVRKRFFRTPLNRGRATLCRALGARVNL